MKSTNWWKYLLAVLVVGASGVIFMGFSTYKDAPPKPDYISPSGVEIVQQASVERGQLVFQKYALMEYGSMFGDGAAPRTGFYCRGAPPYCSRYEQLLWQPSYK